MVFTPIVVVEGNQAAEGVSPDQAPRPRPGPDGVVGTYQCAVGGLRTDQRQQVKAPSDVDSANRRVRARFHRRDPLKASLPAKRSPSPPPPTSSRAAVTTLTGQRVVR